MFFCVSVGEFLWNYTMEMMLKENFVGKDFYGSLLLTLLRSP